MELFFSYLFYFVASSVSPLQRRWLSQQRNVNSNSAQIHFAFLVSLIIAVLGLLLICIKPFYITGSTHTLLTLSLITGLFGGGHFICLYIAQKHVEAGITTLVVNIYTPITIALASWLLHESLTPLQILGTVLLLAGMAIVSKKHKIGRFSFDIYFLLVVLCGICVGIAFTAERALQKMTGFTAGTLMSWWSQCLMLGIAVLIVRGKNAYSKTDVAITGTLRFLQSLSWVTLVLVIGNLSLVSAVTTFKVIVVFAAAALFLKEREDLPRKILGSLVALAGLFLLS